MTPITTHPQNDRDIPLQQSIRLVILMLLTVAMPERDGAKLHGG